MPRSGPAPARRAEAEGAAQREWRSRELLADGGFIIAFIANPGGA
jgi:hypothetical protein